MRPGTRPWTDAEDGVLRQGALAGKPVAEIASEVGRTESALRHSFVRSSSMLNARAPSADLQNQSTVGGVLQTSAARFLSRLPFVRPDLVEAGMLGGLAAISKQEWRKPVGHSGLCDDTVEIRSAGGSSSKSESFGCFGHRLSSLPSGGTHL